jgi:hypothetical protein
MTISDLRFTQMFDDIVSENLSKGRITNPIEVANLIRNLSVESNMTMPFTVMRRQKRKGNFDVEGYNESLSETVVDIEILYKHFVELGSNILEDLQRNETEYKKALSQIRTIDDSLENILLVSQKTNNFFGGIFDFFRDASKVDQGNTTAYIDMEEGGVRLPNGRSSNVKYNMKHLSKSDNINVRVLNRVPSSVFKSANVAGSKFSHMFDDLLTSWQHRIVSDTPGPMVVEMVINLTVTGENIPVTLVEVTPSTVGEVGVQVQHSSDGTNYRTFTGSERAKIMEFDKVSFSTEKYDMKYIKITMSKGEADSKVSDADGKDAYEYMFGLSNVSIMRYGYKDSAVLLSKPLSPDSDLVGDNINTVSISVDEEAPSGTSINYFVAASNDPDKFFQIEPIERTGSLAPKIVDFGSKQHSERKENVINVDSSPTLLDNKNGIDFFNIYTAGHSPIFNSGKLWRGINGFSIDKNQRVQRQTVKNNYIEFTGDDRKIPLYITRFDEVSSHPASNGTDNTALTMDNFIVESSNIKPESNAAPLEQPDWSILRVNRFKSGSGFTGADGTITVAPGNAGQVKTLAASSLTTNSQGFIHVSYVVGSKNISGYFKISQIVSSGNVILEDPRGLLLASTGANVTYESQSEDITAKVESIDGRIVFIDSSQEIGAQDKVVVTYRHTLQSNQSLVSSSVKVVDSTDSSVVYTLGTDYQIDKQGGTISRNKDGNIAIAQDQSSINVRVDFEYNESIDSNYTYSTYVQVTNENPARIRHGGISISDDESVFIDTFKGLIEISSETDLPELESGYHKIIVRSKSIFDSSGNLDPTSALYKVMSMVDEDGDLVFQVGKYFSKMTSYVAPMAETSLFNLQRSVRIENRDFFAIDRSSDSVIINFNPTVSEDLIHIKAAVIPVINDKEEFEFEYDYNIDTDKIESLIFKAALGRYSDSSGDLTPRLLGYHIKIS